MRILLIAGHGAGDSGACGNGYREADLTREMVSLIREQMVVRGIECNIADTSINWFDRIRSNGVPFAHYDQLIEIHFNSGGGHGTELFTPTNRSASDVERNILSNICAVTGYTNRGTKQKNFTVISNCAKKIDKTALLEVCFIDSASDVAIYQQKKNSIAKAVAAAFASESEETKMIEDLKNRIEALEAESKRKNDILYLIGEDIQTLFKAVESGNKEDLRQNDIINIVGGEIDELKRGVEK